MSGSKRVAVVTGSNKGIGFAIVRGLCKQFDGDVYLTARNEIIGLDAVENLKREGLQVKFHQLDITKPYTIKKLKTYLQDSYGGLDILVNNAGIGYPEASTVPFGEQAEASVRTNFTGTLAVSEALFPILRPHARVVNISSIISQFIMNQCRADLRETLLSHTCITMEKLNNLMEQFVDSAKTGTYQDLGWPNTGLASYGISKIGVTIMSFIQQRELLNDARPDVVVNACCPGFVATDLTDHRGTKSIDEGADTPLYLAMLPLNTTSPNGELVSDRTILDWQVTQTY
ncbi:carbonyl reductase [NADPH] 1-like [Ylistrum balloti]|uniref:carbonyl reductase [NADPH] 1-like n=1 Tax=Ylistrum balloti TaxID=509963 RepID=UPI002905DF02|nr:carbonyl reductase [NADPH] 1-like [Ylistrum balloti]